MKFERNVEVMDDNICKKCDFFKMKGFTVKEKDPYGFEKTEKKYVCANKGLCEHLMKFISAEKLLPID